MRHILFFFVMFFSGCAMYVQSNISKFDSMPQNIAGKSFTIVPVGDQVGSAAWQHFANELAKPLVSEGMIRRNPNEAVEYLVFIDYGTGQTRETTTSVPVFGQTGGGYGSFSGSVYGTGGASRFYGTTYTPATYGVVYNIPVTRRSTDRYMSLRIIDMVSSTPSNIVSVYEASVTSTGQASSFELVGACMIKALNENFRTTENKVVNVSREYCDI